MSMNGPQFEQVPLNIVGSSTFGRYPKISIEKTYNMFQSDTALVPYAGYQVAIPASEFDSYIEGRGIYSSVKLGRLVVVQGAGVYLVNINYNHSNDTVTSFQVIKIGTLQTQTGVVYIAENNKPQIGISDGTAFYLYDTVTQVFSAVPLNFTPGYLTFHDTYFILAASNDSTYSPAANNTWRLSESNNGLSWPSTASYVGLLQTKPDDTQAVVRVPSRGNMIFVMGKNVTEAWFNTGAQSLFPYQRNTQFNIDYGCLNPATVASLDNVVVWLAKNESSGPVIMASTGGEPKQISTDGIDYLFSTLQYAEDAQGFLYKQDGHLFYHINFYRDNLSFFYDFNLDKIYQASDQRMNYFIAAQVAFFKNQYYFITRNNGYLYALDTTITTYQDVDSNGNITTVQIPRIRICKNIRSADQSYAIINDLGFTVESGETPYVQQILPDGSNSGIGPLSLSRVDLSISYDGGATFSNSAGQNLRPIGLRKNKLVFWQLGIANDAVVQVRFWSYGRIVAFDGILNVR